MFIKVYAYCLDILGESLKQFIILLTVEFRYYICQQVQSASLKLVEDRNDNIGYQCVSL